MRITQWHSNSAATGAKIIVGFNSMRIISHKKHTSYKLDKVSEDLYYAMYL